MQLKKIIHAAVFTTCILAVFCTGCTNIVNSNETTNVLSSSDESVAVIKPTEETDVATKTTASMAESKSLQTDIPENNAEYSTSATTDLSNEIVGNTGLTVSQWLEKANVMYQTAITTYNTYLCSSDGFQYQTDENSIDGWMLVTSCSTVEEATQPYFDIFAVSQHNSDLDGQFQMIDGNLYRLCGDRGMDITYISSEITTLTESTEDSLVFQAVSTYCEPDKEEQNNAYTQRSDIFTIVLENGQWKVGQFTMPY